MYTVQFQEMNEGDDRPGDYALNEMELETGNGKATPIPNVDDYISINSKLYRVRSKLFGYHKENSWVNIVVTEIPLDEKGVELYGRLVKE